MSHSDRSVWIIVSMLVGYWGGRLDLSPLQIVVAAIYTAAAIALYYFLVDHLTRILRKGAHS